MGNPTDPKEVEKLRARLARLEVKPPSSSIPRRPSRLPMAFGVFAAVIVFFFLFLSIRHHPTRTVASGGSQTTSPSTADAKVAEIDPAAVAPYRRAFDSDIFERWGTKGAARLSEFRKAAAETVARNPQCGRVSYVDLADEAHGTRFPEHPVMIVDCIPVQRFFISEQDIGEVTPSQSQIGRAISKTGAIQICLDLVRQKLTYPSSMSPNLLSIWADESSATGNWGVSFQFQAQNALGAKIPETANCVIPVGGQPEASIEIR